MILGLTLRHLYEIENYVINPDTHEQLQKVQNLIENFNKVFTRQEKMALFDGVTEWLKDYNVRVSLLLRMGLQDMDGKFVTNNLTPVAQELLKNIGEYEFRKSNIWNGKPLNLKYQESNV